MTPEQAADYLQVNRETIYRYIRDGRLDASRLGRGYRISRQSLELLLLATRTRPHVHLRDYSAEQLAELQAADLLDGHALDIAQDFDRATSGGFFRPDGDGTHARRPA
ncbi:MAG: helix-turn-helix domain-containing protein [Chloroflexota bacterium]